MPRFDLLELHVTHTCNLACESCSHYSNQGHSGQISLAEADRWMGLWSHRVDVNVFNLLGGEPTIHPELTAFVPLVRKHWPKALIRVITNGFRLARHPDLPRVLAADGNADIALSVHHEGAAYVKRVLPVLSLLNGWRRDFGIRVQIWDSHEVWTRRYHGEGAAMLPFDDNDQRASWSICPARQCKQLHEGKLWKCAPLAYLPMQKAKYDIGGVWDPYLAYRPLEPDCSDAELADFSAREDESVCTMCCAKKERLMLPTPHRADQRAEA